jgi:hypothetical protein
VSESCSLVFFYDLSNVFFTFMLQNIWITMVQIPLT